MMNWGVPGKGRWITIYANAGHAFAVIDGLRWDTVGDSEGTGPRWHTEMVSTRASSRATPPATSRSIPVRPSPLRPSEVRPGRLDGGPGRL